MLGSKCYILRDRESSDKFDSKSGEGIFLGYSRNSRAYRVYNLSTRVVTESINVVIEDAISEIGVKNWDEMGNLSEDLVTVTEPIEQTT